MAWGRLDDQANNNGKLLALSDAAWRMWGCGIIHCQNQLTDGFISAAAIHTFGVRAKNKHVIADELCQSQLPGQAALWSRVDGGYQVHDYLDWNESRAEIVGRRERDLKRKGFHKDSPRIPRGRTKGFSADSAGPTPNTSTQPKEQAEVPRADVDAYVAGWNEITTPPIGRCRDVTAKRLKHIRNRLREYPITVWLREIFPRIQASSFARGVNERGWKVSFDWIIESPDNAVKVLEGKYDDRTPKASAHWSDGCQHEPRCQAPELHVHLLSKAEQPA